MLEKSLKVAAIEIAMVTWNANLIWAALGGASFSMASLRAAGLGAAVALPQVLASFVARSPGARCIVPELEDVWQEQVRDLKPAVSNMTAQQACPPPPPPLSPSPPRHALLNVNLVGLPILPCR